MAFYQAVEEALRRREMPGTVDSRVDYKEEGLLSAKRKYLHVRREQFVFDICGAPFGTGFFFSWWFAEDTPELNPIVRLFVLIALLTFVGWLILKAGIVIGVFLVSAIVLAGLGITHAMSAMRGVNDGIVRVLPLLGPLYLWLFKPNTYYRIDSMEMFRATVHHCVLEVIDRMTTAKGLRALADDQRKPIMHELYSGRQ